jgi:hypothetical protein
MAFFAPWRGILKNGVRLHTLASFILPEALANPRRALQFGQNKFQNPKRSLYPITTKGDSLLQQLHMGALSHS